MPSKPAHGAQLRAAAGLEAVSVVLASFHCRMWCDRFSGAADLTTPFHPSFPHCPGATAGLQEGARRVSMRSCLRATARSFRHVQLRWRQSSRQPRVSRHLTGGRVGLRRCSVAVLVCAVNYLRQLYSVLTMHEVVLYRRAAVANADGLICGVAAATVRRAATHPRPNHVRCLRSPKLADPL